jgi:capsular polysaccharide biosynthesis protein
VTASRRVLLPLAAAGALAAVAGVIDSVRTPTYRADAKLVVRPALGEQGRPLETRMRTLADLVTSRAVAEDVVHALHMDASADDLRGRIRAQTRRGTAVIDVTADAASSNAAARIVQQVALSFVAIARTRFGARGDVAVWDAAPASAEQVGPDGLRDAGLAAATGALAAAAVAYAPLRRRPRIAAAEEARPAAEGQWSLGELARRVRADTAHPERHEEWRAYLDQLAPYAGPDGRLPDRLDGLVQEVFGALV